MRSDRRTRFWNVIHLLDDPEAAIAVIRKAE